MSRGPTHLGEDWRATSKRSVHIYFELTKDSSGYPPYSTEEVDAEAVGGLTYRVVGIPVFVYGVGPGDVVRCERRTDSDRPFAVEVLSNAGHWVSRVIPFGSAGRSHDDLERLAARFGTLGCETYVSPFGMLAIAGGPDVPVAPVISLLESGRQSRKWDFDFGVSPSR